MKIVKLDAKNRVEEYDLNTFDVKKLDELDSGHFYLELNFDKEKQYLVIKDIVELKQVASVLYAFEFVDTTDIDYASLSVFICKVNSNTREKQLVQFSIVNQTVRSVDHLLELLADGLVTEENLTVKG